MTGPAQLAGSDLDRCFEVFTVSVFGLEALRAYAVPGEEEDRLRSFRPGLPRPERPARASAWLRRVAAATAAGKSWHRVCVLDRPLSGHECHRLLGYRESAEASSSTRRRVKPAAEPDEDPTKSARQ